MLDHLHHVTYPRDARPTRDRLVPAVQFVDNIHGHKIVGSLVAVSHARHDLFQDGRDLCIRRPCEDDGELHEGGVGLGIEKDVDGVGCTLGNDSAAEEDFIELAVRGGGLSDLQVAAKKTVEQRIIDGGVFG